MTYEIYRYIFYGGAILAGVMLAITVILFFAYKIPTVIGDLTGANARKAIENIRNQNENSGDKVYKTSQVNRERGKITAKMTPSGNLARESSGGLGGAMPTEKISTQELPQVNETTLLGANETTVLGANETAVLGANETTVLGTNETTVLGGGGAGETTLLSAETTPATFQIEYEITFIHTDEVIA